MKTPPDPVLQEIEKIVIICAMYAWEQGKKQHDTPRHYTLHDKPVIEETEKRIYNLVVDGKIDLLKDITKYKQSVRTGKLGTVAVFNEAVLVRDIDARLATLEGLREGK